MKLRFLRAFVPSWRFFDRLEHVPHLSYRICKRGGVLGPWTALPSALKRPIHALLFNPKGNLDFACHALIEQLVVDINSDVLTDHIANLVSYRLVTNMLRVRLRQIEAIGSAERFQFKISIQIAKTGEAIGDSVVSTEHEI